MKFRKIMRYAGMYVIKLFPTDVKDYDLIGCEVDIEDSLKTKRKVKDKK